jgi:hypothetical protein
MTTAHESAVKEILIKMVQQVPGGKLDGEVTLGDVGSLKGYDLLDYASRVAELDTTGASSRRALADALKSARTPPARVTPAPEGEE